MILAIVKFVLTALTGATPFIIGYLGQRKVEPIVSEMEDLQESYEHKFHVYVFMLEQGHNVPSLLKEGIADFLKYEDLEEERQRILKKYSVFS